jgi:hypothetical protein
MISISWSSAPVARRYLFSPGCYILAIAWFRSMKLTYSFRPQHQDLVSLE